MNSTSILNELDEIIYKFGPASEANESDYSIAVEKVLKKLDGKEDPDLIKSIIAKLDSIPDECAELFPFEIQQRLMREYGVDYHCKWM